METRELKPTPWSERAGIPESTLRSFLSGRSSALRHDTLEKLAMAAGATIAELVGEIAPGTSRQELVGIASLSIQKDQEGRVMPGEDSEHEPLFWPKSWVEKFLGGKANNGRYLEIVGDSLVGSYKDGDLVCVDLSRLSPNRDPGIYCLYDGADVVVRRLQTVPGNESLRIISENARYESFNLDTAQVQILGRIVWHCGGE